MLPLRGDARILCADPSGERLARLTERLRSAGLTVFCTRSAAECLSIAAEYQPRAIILDSEFLQVDLENIPEYIARISATTSVFLAVENPVEWQDRWPQYVDAVIKRDDLDSFLSLLRG